MQKILIQLDPDPHPSTFDRVVAVDSGVDQLFSYGGVTPENVVPLVHGAIFTRSPKHLKNTAIFVGGSNVGSGEAIVSAIRKAFFGPLKVSVLLDANGCNTTAAAAVLSAAKHGDLTGRTAIVLGGTGPVGRRITELLARASVRVEVASRSVERAAAVCSDIVERVPGADLTPTTNPTGTDSVSAELLFAAGAAGAQLLSEDQWSQADQLKVAIDLNAVPPVGLEAIDITDSAKERHGVTCYGAIGVGGLKMKIHKAAVASLFDANDQDLDTAAVYEIGRQLVADN